MSVPFNDHVAAAGRRRRVTRRLPKAEEDDLQAKLGLDDDETAELSEQLAEMRRAARP